jgi:hypothetical protein
MATVAEIKRILFMNFKSTVGAVIASVVLSFETLFIFQRNIT